ncbi:MAG: putative toxin-antitoxin system toxin component, PIN family [Bacteroidetes bacterium]|nr:putative toxin-antitoxin system toxin component, PIN family [Bacteroidota bacterium]
MASKAKMLYLMLFRDFMKIVFDTNISLSSLLFPGFSSKVYDFCVSNYNVFSSQWLFNELENKLLGKSKLTEAQTELILETIKERVSVVHPSNSIPDACRDKDDNHVLQLAEYIQADYIITGDKDLLILESFLQTKIESPRDFFNQFIEN